MNRGSSTMPSPLRAASVRLFSRASQSPHFYKKPTRLVRFLSARG